MGARRGRCGWAPQAGLQADITSSLAGLQWRGLRTGRESESEPGLPPGKEGPWKSQDGGLEFRWSSSLGTRAGPRV